MAGVAGELTPEQYEVLFGEPPTVDELTITASPGEVDLTISPPAPIGSPPPPGPSAQRSAPGPLPAWTPPASTGPRVVLDPPAPPPPRPTKQLRLRPGRPGRPWWKKKRFLFPTGALVVTAGLAALSGQAGGPSQADITEAPIVGVAVGEPQDANGAAVAPALTAAPNTTTAPTTTAPTTTVEATPITAAPPTETSTTNVSIGTVASAQELLTAAPIVAELVAPVPYSRDEYTGGGWGDADGDCISDRHEILLERSDVDAEMSADGCSVSSGQWTDPYDGAIYTDARDVTIDHFVPLAAAHRAGAWAWDIDTKRAFSADITFEQSHATAGQGTNQDKADSSPDTWRPSESRWCGYAVDWIAVKSRWELNYSAAEVDALQEMLDSCEPAAGSDTNAPVIPGAAPVTSTTLPATTTTIVATPGPAVVSIANCDARAETVTLINTGGESITLTSWVLHDQGRNHEHNLGRITLDPAGQIVLLSGRDTLDEPGKIRWSNQNVWNNDGDAATLLSNGEAVATARC